MTGIDLIAIERKEQIEKHGWDDTHTLRRTLTQAALFCINNVSLRQSEHVYMENYPKHWSSWFQQKVQDKRRRMNDTDFQIEMLKIAGAFIAASIDKLLPLTANK